MDGVGEDLEAAGHGAGGRGERSSTNLDARQHPPLIPSLTPIDCCVEAPAHVAAKARYALTELLRGLGRAPVWCDRDALAAPGVYYGTDPEAAPADVLALGIARATVGFFAARTRYRPSDALPLGGDHAGAPVLFALADGRADLIASAFFWLSGWQEFTRPERDPHARFPYASSLQAELRCAGVPVVDRYRLHLSEQLRAIGAEVSPTEWRGKRWAVALTHDIDHGRKRRIGTVARAILRRDGRRLDALRQSLGPDPRLASLHRMATLERELGAGATYFVKTAARGPWDLPYRLDRGELRRFLLGLRRDGFEIGLHPSFFAYDHPGHLAAELARLRAAGMDHPVSVRQHYLRFDPVRTPRLQATAGFALDATLGFAEREGFRRGTCHPFRLYDIERDEPLGLWEVPLTVMDTTLFTYRRLDAEAAEAAAWEVLAAARSVGGCAVVLWHNTAFDEVDFPGQGGVWERTVRRARREGAALLSLRSALEEVADFTDP